MNEHLSNEPEPLPMLRVAPLVGETVEPDPHPDDGPPPEPVTPLRKPRVTVTGTVVHQVPGGQPKSPPRTRFFRWLEEDEEAYSRTVKVGGDWVPLDLGWVGERCSLLVLANATKLRTQRQPTQDELSSLLGKVIEVAVAVPLDGRDFHQPFAEIPIGEDMRLSPREPSRYRVRCRSGEGKYTVFLVPG